MVRHRRPHPGGGQAHRHAGVAVQRRPLPERPRGRVHRQGRHGRLPHLQAPPRPPPQGPVALHHRRRGPRPRRPAPQYGRRGGGRAPGGRRGHPRRGGRPARRRHLDRLHRHRERQGRVHRRRTPRPRLGRRAGRLRRHLRPDRCRHRPAPRRWQGPRRTAPQHPHRRLQQDQVPHPRRHPARRQPVRHPRRQGQGHRHRHRVRRRRGGCAGGVRAAVAVGQPHRHRRRRLHALHLHLRHLRRRGRLPRPRPRGRHPRPGRRRGPAGRLHRRGRRRRPDRHARRRPHLAGAEGPLADRPVRRHPARRRLPGLQPQLRRPPRRRAGGAVPRHRAGGVPPPLPPLLRHRRPRVLGRRAVLRLRPGPLQPSALVAHPGAGTHRGRHHPRPRLRQRLRRPGPRRPDRAGPLLAGRLQPLREVLREAVPLVRRAGRRPHHQPALRRDLPGQAHPLHRRPAQGPPMGAGARR